MSKQLESMMVKKFDEVVFENPRISVEVDIVVDASIVETLKKSFSDLVITRFTQRKTTMYVRGFNFKRPNILNFTVEAETPKSFVVGYSAELDEEEVVRPEQLIATNFPDFCWVMSEGTSPYNAKESNTPHREDALLGDLTWVLPSKFADDLIELMHCLNLEVLEGVLQDAVLYGPIFIGPRSSSDE